MSKYNDNDFFYGDGWDKKEKKGGRAFGIIAVMLIALILAVMALMMVVLPGGQEQGSPIGNQDWAANPTARPSGGGNTVTFPNGSSNGGSNNGGSSQVVTGGPSSTAVPDGTSIGQILGSDDNPVVQIAEDMKNSVVGVSAMVAVADSGGVTDYRELSYGSGVVIEGGYIITNFHVVIGADMVSVIFYDGEMAQTEVIGFDDINDVAVLKLLVPRDDLKPAKLGVSAEIEIGQMAIAIGNPLGTLANTVTFGAISAVDREIDNGGATITLIQTDAAINPGNSGGPLLNADGEVVGINTYMVLDTGSSSARIEGLNFAMPIDVIKPVVDEIIATGRYTRPGIGIRGTTFTKLEAAYYEYYNNVKGIEEGIYVAELVEDGNAGKAGVMAGDIITHVNDERITSYGQLRQYLEKNTDVGENVQITVIRYNEENNSFEPFEFEFALIGV